MREQARADRVLPGSLGAERIAVLLPEINFRHATAAARLSRSTAHGIALRSRRRDTTSSSSRSRAASRRGATRSSPTASRGPSSSRDRPPTVLQGSRSARTVRSTSPTTCAAPSGACSTSEPTSRVCRAGKRGVLGRRPGRSLETHRQRGSPSSHPRASTPTRARLRRARRRRLLLRRCRPAPARPGSPPS